MKNSSPSFASDLSFHQIALVTAKPSLTTTIIHDIHSIGTRIIFHPERELAVIVVVQCDFAATSAI